MWEQFNPWLAGGGLGIGIAFGFIAQRSRFCVVAAFSNLVLMRDYRQLHAYLTALGVAVLGTFALEWLELVPHFSLGCKNSLLWVSLCVENEEVLP